MKKWLVILGIVATAFAATAYVTGQSASAAPKAVKGVLVGDAIEISTYAMKGPGEEHFEGGKHRAENGFPVGILEDETGIVWVCVYRDSAPASHLETGNESLAPYIGQKVVVQGLKYTAKGANVIRVSVISEY